MADTRALLDRFNEISAQLADPAHADEMDALLAEMGQVQERIDARRRLEPRPGPERRDGRPAGARRPTPR